MKVPEDTTPSNNWDAFKAYLRGQCVSLNAALNKQRAAERLLLETELQTEERLHEEQATFPHQRKVTALR